MASHSTFVLTSDFSREKYLRYSIYSVSLPHLPIPVSHGFFPPSLRIMLAKDEDHARGADSDLGKARGARGRVRRIEQWINTEPAIAGERSYPPNVDSSDVKNVGDGSVIVKGNTGCLDSSFTRMEFNKMEISYGESRDRSLVGNSGRAGRRRRSGGKYVVRGFIIEGKALTRLELVRSLRSTGCRNVAERVKSSVFEPSAKGMRREWCVSRGRDSGESRGCRRAGGALVRTRFRLERAEDPGRFGGQLGELVKTRNTCPRSQVAELEEEERWGVSGSRCAWFGESRQETQRERGRGTDMDGGQSGHVVCRTCRLYGMSTAMVDGPDITYVLRLSTSAAESRFVVQVLSASDKKQEGVLFKRGGCEREERSLDVFGWQKWRVTELSVDQSLSGSRAQDNRGDTDDARVVRGACPIGDSEPKHGTRVALYHRFGVLDVSQSSRETSSVYAVRDRAISCDTLRIGAASDSGEAELDALSYKLRYRGSLYVSTMAQRKGVFELRSLAADSAYIKKHLVCETHWVSIRVAMSQVIEYARLRVICSKGREDGVISMVVASARRGHLHDEEMDAAPCGLRLGCGTRRSVYIEPVICVASSHELRDLSRDGACEYWYQRFYSIDRDTHFTVSDISCLKTSTEEDDGYDRRQIQIVEIQLVSLIAKASRAFISDMPKVLLYFCEEILKGNTLDLEDTMAKNAVLDQSYRGGVLVYTSSSSLKCKKRADRNQVYEVQGVSSGTRGIRRVSCGTRGSEQVWGEDVTWQRVARILVMIGVHRRDYDSMGSIKRCALSVRVLGEVRCSGGRNIETIMSGEMSDIRADGVDITHGVLGQEYCRYDSASYITLYGKSLVYLEVCSNEDGAYDWMVHRRYMWALVIDGCDVVTCGRSVQYGGVNDRRSAHYSYGCDVRVGGEVRYHMSGARSVEDGFFIVSECVIGLRVVKLYSSEDGVMIHICAIWTVHRLEFWRYTSTHWKDVDGFEKSDGLSMPHPHESLTPVY
ncbi:hypothetical protein Tco_1167313 [Tanacetum coccineum]